MADATDNIVAVTQSNLTSSTPLLKHVILINDRQQVVGVTSTAGSLQILCSPSQQQILVYDMKTFKQKGALHVKELSDITTGSGLASCETNQCVYVSDSDAVDKDVVLKVELTGNNKVLTWSVGQGPQGLSVNTACNLLISCRNAHKIEEYTTTGSLIREIFLQPKNVVLSPYHAIQLTVNRFVVSYRNETTLTDDVVEVDGMGRLVVSYTDRLQSTTEKKFRYPRWVSASENCECIFVADSRNDRIIIQNRASQCRPTARELNANSLGGKHEGPFCLYFESSQNRLFVGESGLCRLLVLENVL